MEIVALEPLSPLCQQSAPFNCKSPITSQDYTATWINVHLADDDDDDDHNLSCF